LIQKKKKKKKPLDGRNDTNCRRQTAEGKGEEPESAVDLE
jgi:hypothetical protein